jgi:hypothetical protein
VTEVLRALQASYASLFDPRRELDGLGYILHRSGYRDARISWTFPQRKGEILDDLAAQLPWLVARALNQWMKRCIRLVNRRKFHSKTASESHGNDSDDEEWLPKSEIPQEFLTMLVSFASLMELWCIRIAFHETTESDKRMRRQEMRRMCRKATINSLLGRMRDDYDEYLTIEVSCSTYLRVRLFPYLPPAAKARLQHALEPSQNHFRILLVRYSFGFDGYDSIEYMHDLHPEASAPFLEAAQTELRDVMFSYECQKALLKDVFARSDLQSDAAKRNFFLDCVFQYAEDVRSNDPFYKVPIPVCSR